MILTDGVVRSPKPKLIKYFGRCIRKDGAVVMLVAKAVNEVEACAKLHKGYSIVMVDELLTGAQMEREWAKIKPSLIQRSALI